MTQFTRVVELHY